MKLILGSNSQRRQDILKELGFSFEVVPADIDEKEAERNDPTNPAQAVAKAKAEYIKKSIKDEAVIITADTLTLYKDKIRGKPLDLNQAKDWLKQYSQNQVKIITALVVVHNKTGQTLAGQGESTVYFSLLPESLIEEILANGHILDAAGAFRVQDPELRPYIERIEGEWEACLGLPKKLLLDFFDKLNLRNNV